MCLIGQTVPTCCGRHTVSTFGQYVGVIASGGGHNVFHAGHCVCASGHSVYTGGHSVEIDGQEVSIIGHIVSPVTQMVGNSGHSVRIFGHLVTMVCCVHTVATHGQRVGSGATGHSVSCAGQCV